MDTEKRIEWPGAAKSPAEDRRLLLLRPRGFCAGVVRAIEVVRLAIEQLGGPIYVHKEIVHNRHVVNNLAQQGAVFVESLDEVQECHHVAGDDDYVLKVRCRDTAHLEVLVTDRLKGLRGVTRTRTSIALATLKETTRLPLEPPDAAPGRGAR